MRELVVDELAEAWELAHLAFGTSAVEPPAVAVEPVAGVTRYGAFDRSGRLLGIAEDLHHDHWWADRLLPAADVAGVAVAPEARGRGIARALLRRVLEGGRDRGAAVSALHPSVTAVYRSGGWAMVGAMRAVDVPTSFLPRHRPDGKLTVDAGAPADLEAAGQLYTEVARARNGMLSWTGRHRSAAGDAFPEGVDGLTLIRDGDRPVGYASWGRGPGTGPDAVLEVVDIIATSGEAVRELIGVLASWRSATPTIRFRAVPSGALTAGLPMEVAKERKVSRWMHRPVDVVRAVSGRSWPASIELGMTFELYDDLAPWNAGTWALQISGGEGHLEPSKGRPALRLQTEGFGFLYCGIASPAMLVEAGLAENGRAGDPALLASLMAAPPPELLDHF